MSDEQFTTHVEGVGAFSFLRRTMRLEMRIGAEYSRLTEGVDTPTQWFELVAGILAAIKVLVVAAPPGWDLEQLDPTDDETWDQLVLIHRALRDQEDTFRRAKKKQSETTGAAAVGNAGVLVPSEIQPAAD